MARWIKRTLDIAPEFRDIDMMGVVHNCVYFTWFERGRRQVMDDIVTFEKAGELGIAIPVRKTECSYEIPVRLGDKLKLITRHRVDDKYAGKLEFTHELVNNATKAVHAAGSCTCTIIETKTGKLLRDWNNELWAHYSKIK